MTSPNAPSPAPLSPFFNLENLTPYSDSIMLLFQLLCMHHSRAAPVLPPTYVCMCVCRYVLPCPATSRMQLAGNPTQQRRGVLSPAPIHSLLLLLVADILSFCVSCICGQVLWPPPRGMHANLKARLSLRLTAERLTRHTHRMKTKSDRRKGG